MYREQSLYPAFSVPDVVRRINRTFQRADQIEKVCGGFARRTSAFRSPVRGGSIHISCDAI